MQRSAACFHSAIGSVQPEEHACQADDLLPSERERGQVWL